MPKPVNRGFDDDALHHRHPGPKPLGANGFGARVRYFNTHDSYHDLLNQVALGDPDLWNTVIAPLAQDLLPAAQLDRLVSRYTHTSQQYEEMLPEERRALAQALLTRLSNILRHPQGEHREEQQEGQAKEKSAAPNPASRSPRPPHSTHSPSPPPSPRQPSPARPPTPPPAEKLPPEEAPESPPPETPTQWDDLSEDEQQELAEQIKNGQIKPQFGPPPPGAKPFDASSRSGCRLGPLCGGGLGRAD